MCNSGSKKLISQQSAVSSQQSAVSSQQSAVSSQQSAVSSQQSAVSSQQSAVSSQQSAVSSQQSFEDLLADLRHIAKNTRESGHNFEILTRQFLLTEPRYKAHYRTIELWAHWAQSKNLQTGKANWANSRDIGIDLVAQRHDGGLCAIQCKFFLTSRISKEMLDSFIAASGASIFSERMFVATGGLSDNLENALRTQEPPIICLNKASFENSAIDWAKYTPESNSLTCISLKTPRDYQETAISRIIDGFKSADRGRLIMACGTGKTFTSLKIAERLRLYPNAAAAKAATNQQKHQGKTELEQAASLAAAKAAEKVACSANIVLFLVPGLALLSQTLREWAAQSQRPITPFAVCSDSSAGHVTRKAKEADEIEYIANELDFPPTTEAGALAQAVTKARTQNPQAMQVIFCTYHSMEVVAEAQAKHGLPAIDLVICDEAHRTAGQSKSGEDKSFARILAADFIRAEKRLFMTATPIVYTPASKKSG